MLYSLVAIVVLTIFDISVEGAKILAVFPTASISHQVVFHAFIKGLARNGHHITMVTADPIKSNADYENVTQIDVHDISYKLFLENIDITNCRLSAKGDVTALLPEFINGMIHVMEGQFNMPEVKKLIREPEAHKFDLFIGESLFPNIFAFAEMYKVPSVGISSLMGLHQQFSLIGNPVHPFLYSHAFSENTGKTMSFWEKVMSLYNILKMDYMTYYNLYPRLDALTKKHFGPNMADSIKLTSEIDILFINSDSLFAGVRPTIPSLVWLGNMHFKDEYPLPKDLQSYLDASKNGVVYMSLGSNVQSNRLPEDTRQMFVETFRELPYDILWKWEDDNLPGKPNNVRIAKWLPQNDILRHPNVKLFITQSGLQSTEEAIKYKVPMIGIPFIADQFFNSKRLEHFEIGIQLDIMTMTKEQLKAAVLQIIENEKFTKNIAKLSKIIHDQPMKPVERAVWWTEYVLRHKGGPHLRSPLLGVSFFEYYMLDVLSILFAGLAAASIITCCVVKHFLRKLSPWFISVEKRKLN